MSMFEDLPLTMYYNLISATTLHPVSSARTSPIISCHVPPPIVAIETIPTQS